jgi:hypothetical protein
MPGALRPPCFVIDAGQPYMAPGDQFGTTKYAFDAIYFSSDSASNQFVSDEIDTATEKATTALAAAGWSVDGVEVLTRPANGGTYAGVALSVTQSIATASGTGSWIELSGTRFGVGAGGLTALTFQPSSGSDLLGLASSTSSEYEFAVTAPQKFSEDSLWRFIFDHAGTQMEFLYSPDGTESASADHPHVTGYLWIPEYPTAGGQANTPNPTFDATLALQSEPELVTA